MTIRYRVRGGGATAMAAMLLAVFVAALLVAPLAIAPKPPGSGPKPTPPPPGPADPAVAYTKVTDGLWTLGVMNANGTAATTLYTVAPAPGNPTLVRHPTWAPDRSALAFTVVRSLAGEVFELWRIDVTVANGVVQGTNPLLLHNYPYYQEEISPAWSPDGTVIAFTEQDADLYFYWALTKLLRTIPANGGAPTTIYTAEDTYGVSDPTWSQAGTEIAWVSTRFIDAAGPNDDYPVLLPVEYSIMVLDLTTNTTRTVFGPVAHRLDELDWARTQDKIMFHAPSPVSGIYTVDISQPDPVPQLVVSSGYQPSTWLPNDAKIAFNAPEYHFRTGKLIGWPIWTYELSTGQQVRVGPGFYPDWVRCSPCP